MLALLANVPRSGDELNSSHKRFSTASCTKDNSKTKSTMTQDTPLRLHVPEPSGRPGQPTDFSYLRLAPAGAARRPPVDIAPIETNDLAYSLVRVLADDVNALRPWAPQADAQLLLRGLRSLIKKRMSAARMLNARPTKKMSFNRHSLGSTQKSN